MRTLILALVLLLPLSSFAEEKAVKKTKAQKAAKPAVEAEAPVNPNAPFALTVKSLPSDTVIPAKNAYCTGAGKDAGHGDNLSPALSWTNGPKGTKSYALIMMDPDVPTDFSNAGKEGVEIELGQLRQPFYHWVLADIPATMHSFKEGADSKGLEKKKPGKTAYGVRGINDYTNFLKDDPKKKGLYAGYDGPCPPWNDARTHRYIFTLYALDVPSLGLTGEFTGLDVVQKMQGHVLGQSKVVGTYTLNPRLIKKQSSCASKRVAG